MAGDEPVDPKAELEDRCKAPCTPLKEYQCFSRASRYAVTKELMVMRLHDGDLVHEHGLKMITLFEKLGNFGVIVPAELSLDLILLSLSSSYELFIVNFMMNKLNPSLYELLNMLVNYEFTINTIKKNKHVLQAAPEKKSSFGKKRKYLISGPSKKFEKDGTSGVKKEKVSKQVDDTCHHCGNKGHWRRNCKDYLDQKRFEKTHDKK